MNIKTQLHANFQSATIIKETPVVSFLITIDCHSENNPHQTAVSLLYTDLMLAGAGEYNREDFLYAINELGISLSVNENEGKITIAVKTLNIHLDKTLKLIEVMLISPAFDLDECKRAIETTNNALVLYKEDARALSHDALRRTLYGEVDRHFDFKPEIIAEALNNITPDDLKKLHERVMESYWTVSIGGNEKTVKDILKHIEKIKKSTATIMPALSSVSTKTIKGKQLVLQTVSSKQNIELSIGGNLPLSLSDPDLAAFSFGLAVLGKWGGFAGRLMSTVREKEGLTYGIYARSEGVSKSEIGYWRIMTFFAPKDVITGITSTLREIDKIHKTGITISEWERFKNILKTGEVLVYDSLSSTVEFVHSALVAGVTLEEYQAYRERMYSCSRAEVNQALKKYLNPENIVISAAGPVDKVAKDLKKLVKN